MLPADEVLHLFISDRPGQTRGVTWFASAIKRLHHLTGYEEAEVVRARAASSLMGFITSPEGELMGDEVVDDQRVSNFQPGVFKYLQPGESVTVPQLDAPDGQFEPFMRAMLRATAAGVGMSYESCSRDYSQTNYSSSRLALLEDRENWKAIQRYLIENFHQPVFEAWLEMAVMGGKLNLPTYEAQPERYKRVKWCPRAWAWIDPQKEVAAYKDAVRCGFKTQAQVVAEQGGDINELMAERQAELELADELGIALDTDPRSEHVAALPEPPLAEVQNDIPEAEEDLIEDEG
jgi:lambda family phage portal protein